MRHSEGLRRHAPPGRGAQLSARHRLATAVDDFVADLQPAVESLARRAGLDSGRAHDDVTLDAYALAAGFMAANQRLSDEEILTLIAVFGGRVDSRLAAATPSDVRRQGLLDGAADYLRTPSALFGLLRDADLAGGTQHARAYYARAMELAHAAVVLDGYTERLELAALERYRAMLLRLLPGGGPGDRRATGETDGPPASGTSGDAQMIATVDGLDEPPPDLDTLMAELDGLIGLEAVKAEVRQLADLLRVERLRVERGLPVAVHTRHLVFTGNPGTGKTTVARLLSRLYRALGAVARGHLVETDRSGLVAGYVGQTAQRTADVCEAADGGVLLVDEAYALARGDQRDFGQEAIDTLVKVMEDKRDSLVVIVAGYPQEMAEFIASNPGLSSRFPKTIQFPDYSAEELVAITRSLAERSHYRLTGGAARRLRETFAASPRDRGFGNGRLARNLFERAVARQASRVVRKGPQISDEDLMTITATDVGEVIAR